MWPCKYTNRRQSHFSHYLSLRVISYPRDLTWKHWCHKLAKLCWTLSLSPLAKIPTLWSLPCLQCLNSSPFEIINVPNGILKFWIKIWWSECHSECNTCLGNISAKCVVIISLSPTPSPSLLFDSRIFALPVGIFCVIRAKISLAESAFWAIIIETR